MSVEWAVGVTTVPARRNDLLPQTLASLRAGGWERPRLFVDGGGDGASWSAEFLLDVTARCGEPARVAANWLLALAELYWRRPWADRYLVVQDDVVCCRHLREYLEAAPFPELGYQNLYTSLENEAVVHGKKKGTWHEGARIPGGREYHGKPQQRGRGALALCFDGEGVRALLSSPHMAKKPTDRLRGWRGIDGAVVEAMNMAGFTEWVHCPTLVQHRGDVSTIMVPTGPGGELQPRHRIKRALTFMGEDFDARKFLEVGK